MLIPQLHIDTRNMMSLGMDADMDVLQVRGYIRDTTRAAAARLPACSHDLVQVLRPLESQNTCL